MTNNENNIWHGLSLNTIYNMDCIEGMKLIPDWSIDCIITDPPYWTTACKRDTVIPFDLMREQLKRIIKPNGAIVLFWSEPFSSALRMSNIKMYKYDWIWGKWRWTWFQIVKYKPLVSHENISVFWKWAITYNPQMRDREKPRISKNKWTTRQMLVSNWNEYIAEKSLDKKYPITELQFSNNNQKDKVHPTQKPVALLEYLIKTYTLEGETVLDFTMWSWTTAIACINTNRNYIWFEISQEYVDIANKRIQDRLSEK